MTNPQRRPSRHIARRYLAPAAGGEETIELVIEPGSFAARVESRRVDLVDRIRSGIPEREYHACSEGMFPRGKRVMIAAPKKTGKSLAMLAHWVRMALASERVVILDRENGGDEYSRRLEAIVKARDLRSEHERIIEENLIYIEYPRLRRDDAKDLVRYFAHDLSADLVCFDSQRMFLSDFDLAEKDSDDYARFMDYAIDPLARAGVTTCLLDNTGHGDQTRGRGTASKGDLNEILMFLEEIAPFDKTTTGAVRLVIDDSRFGDSGSWTMPIGGGVFGDWISTEQRVRAIAEHKPEFRDAVTVVLTAAGVPMGVNKLLSAVRDGGVKVSDHDAREMLRIWKNEDDSALHYRRNQGYVIER